MTQNLFSVPIFFIVFRETLEAAIIISVLLGLVEQIVKEDPNSLAASRRQQQQRSRSDEEGGGGEKEGEGEGEGGTEGQPELLSAEEQAQVDEKRLLKKLRLQVFVGSAIGLIIAFAIGAAFIAVWFTEASDLWAKSEELWEGIFELIASLMIFAMGVTMLKLDRAKAKWRVKLQRAFEKGKHVDGRTKTGKWVLLILPLITVLREGIEAVIFVGGVSLGQSAKSIPIAAIVGLVCGVTVGYLIYEFASRTTLKVFLIVMTNFLLLIGAGLFSKAIWAFQTNAFNTLLGADVDDAGGDGPGSYDVRGNVWHLDCCNPENTVDGNGWLLFGAIFGWTNSATIGSVLSYIFYWLACVVTLVVMKWHEGRTRFLGKESATGRRRRVAREEAKLSEGSTEKVESA